MTKHSTGRTCPPHASRGLTCERYEELVADAGGSCQICGDNRHLVIDHDHGVGDWAVRGILCSTCNAFLYWMEGPSKDAYLASPWYAAHPEHPVTPTPRASTAAAEALYWELDRLMDLFSVSAKAERPLIRKEAESVALALLAEGEMQMTVVKRAPFSVAHLRNVARRSGLGALPPGPQFGSRARQKVSLS